MSSVAEAMTEREERFSTVYGTEDVLDVVMVLIATERHREGLKIPECPHGNRAGRCLPPPPRQPTASPGVRVASAGRASGRVTRSES